MKLLKTTATTSLMSLCPPRVQRLCTTDTAGAGATNEHGIAHRRGFANQPTIAAIPDLRPGLDSPPGSSGGSGTSSGGGGSGSANGNRAPFQGLHFFFFFLNEAAIFPFKLPNCHTRQN